MSVFDSPAFEGHESVTSAFDERTGLRTVIAVHSTALGPAAGGCRMWPYASGAAALDDALRLSRAMSYKNAMAGIPFGGGKAVIMAAPGGRKSEALFEAFGAAVEGLGGRYWTAEDVGVTPADLVAARRRTRFVAGLDGHPAASGDPSPVTAEGVFRGLRLAVEAGLGRDLRGVRVAVQGAGAVGSRLCAKLAAAGARVSVADVDPEAAARVAGATGAEAVPAEKILDVDAEVFAPCALGGAISLESLGRLKARVIAGGANNQLADAAAGRRLFEEGRIYAPDYVINGGGIINVACEILALQAGRAFDPGLVAAKLDALTGALADILESSRREGRPTQEIADERARARIAAGRPTGAFTPA